MRAADIMCAVNTDVTAEEERQKTSTTPGTFWPPEANHGKTAGEIKVN